MYKFWQAIQESTCHLARSMMILKGPVMNHVYISLGSNVGDRKKAITLAIHKLSTFAVVERISSLIETQPQEVQEPQRKYINGVVKILTELSPSELLQKLQEVELESGRSLSEKGLKKARPIDLDILTFNQDILQYQKLEIPHPRMHDRDFVLIPLDEIAPKWKHPVLNQTARELLSRLGSFQGRQNSNSI